MDDGNGAVLWVWMIVGLVIAIAQIAAMWKIFDKGGQPGWAAIVPFYNLYIWCKLVGRPGWWVILFFIPLVGFVVAIIVNIDLAKSFGKTTGYAIGLILLHTIFVLMLGFGSAEYKGPAAA